MYQLHGPGVLKVSIPIIRESSQVPVDVGFGYVIVQKVQCIISFQVCNVLECGPPPQTSTTSGITEGSNSFW